MDIVLSYNVRVVFTIVFTFVTISGIVMNTAVLFVFLRNKTLRHQVANLFIITLAVTDLLNLITVMPFSILSLYSGSWLLGEAFCKISAFFDTLFGLESVLTLVVISLDRWLAVMKPLRYRAKMTVGRATQMICFTIVQAFVFSLVPLFGEWYAYNKRYGTCTFISKYSSTKYLSFMCSMFVANIVIPLVVMLLTYSFIFKVARSHSRRIACAVVQIFNAPPVRQKIRNFGVRQREVRTAVKISFVIGAFLFCHIPYSIVRMVETGEYLTTGITLPIILTSTIKWIAYSKSTINPFVYSLIQKRFRKALLDLFRKKALRRSVKELIPESRNFVSLSISTTTSKCKITTVSPIQNQNNSNENGTSFINNP